MSITASDLADLITTTQKELGELRYTDLSTDIQEYTALSRMMQESSVTFEAGPSIQWNLMVDNSGAAKQTGLFAVDSLNIGDVMSTAEIGWKHTTVNYAIERREIAFNRDPRKLVDLVKVRRNDAMTSLTDHLETQFWSVPGSDLDVNGVGYWISDAVGMTTDSLTDGDFGFQGDTPVGYSAVAGIDPTNIPRWQNGLGQFPASDISNPVAALGGDTGGTPSGGSGIALQPDVLKVMKEAYIKCNFKPIPNAAYPNYNPTPDRWGIYCGYDTLAALEIMQARLNDLVVSRDVAQDANGSVTFRGVPITYVPKLDSFSGTPIYMIQWGSFRSVFLSGEYLKETGPSTAPNQHTVFTTHVDLTMNLQCVDRRRNALLCSGAVA